MPPREAEFEILADAETLARRAAAWLAGAVTTTHGPIAISLAGGSTPRRLYELLTQAPYRDAFPWTRAHWFWGDERFVDRMDSPADRDKAAIGQGEAVERC